MWLGRALVGAWLLVEVGFHAFQCLLQLVDRAGGQAFDRDAVEVFGRAPLAKGQFMHLLRVGNKLLLVSVSNAGVEPLTEITDPIEVDRLAGLCKQSHPHSSTTAFRQVFQQFGNQNAAR